MGTIIYTPSPVYAAGLFGYNERKADGIEPFLQWQQAIERHSRMLSGTLPPCDIDEKTICMSPSTPWDLLVEQFRELPKGRQLIQVNKLLNQVQQYVLDPINWKREDYWASPAQFFNKGGDCEDFSILKYFVLKDLGWRDEQLRIVVVHDNSRDLPHAVLAVSYKDREFILDNQIDVVVQHSRILHYRPIYSVNQNSWWRHTPSQSNNNHS